VLILENLPNNPLIPLSILSPQKNKPDSKSLVNENLEFVIKKWNKKSVSKNEGI